MCTSFIVNRNKSIVGWNLDILAMEYRVNEYDFGVFIEINDSKEGWMPLFGVNDNGDFVGMPTCWPFDDRSNPASTDDENVIMLDIDLLTKKKTFDEIKKIVKTKRICSVPDNTFMSSISDKNGNALHIIPGQGYKYYEKPLYKVLTNFSPFKMDSELHPWMGYDRYTIANELLANASDDFDVKDAFNVLKNVSQQECPTVVSMVYDISDNTVYWCEKQEWDNIKKRKF